MVSIAAVIVEPIIIEVATKTASLMSEQKGRRKVNAGTESNRCYRRPAMWCGHRSRMDLHGNRHRANHWRNDGLQNDKGAIKEALFNFFTVQNKKGEKKS